MNKSLSEYLVMNSVQAVLLSNKRQKAKHLKNIFLTWYDPEIQGVQELILCLFKVHSWLTSGWKRVIFWWYFHTFHENGDRVLLKIRLKTPKKSILEAVLFMYLLTNTNIAGIQLFYDPTCCCCADYGYGVSKVWCQWLKDKNMTFDTLY